MNSLARTLLDPLGLRRPAFLAVLLPGLALGGLVGCSGSDNNLVTPVIGSFKPASGTCLPTGTTVTVTGSGFLSGAGITSLSVGGATVPSGYLYNDSQITFTLPPAAVTGVIAVSTSGGNASSTGSPFVVVPQITGIAPTPGVPGQPVTITGAGFADITQTLFGTVQEFAYSNIVPNSFTTTLPATLTGASVSVTVTAGGATSAAYTYTLAE